ncbi:MAG: elongation factor Ts [Alphaproteobacteria bacterium]|nr:elongation factor Ts [Alphaproteobacteria bacterium]MDE2012046.1 elongation factor Ts [Alphaproteobacteria bacterium]MDE2074198.1 elongation factor Ts [Alphaproteobacteria bacterium]
MANITASMVKDLRDKTGAGMMDCKAALGETSGDMEAAIDWLRTKGLAKAAKKAGRVAAEGLIGVAVDAHAGALVEVNSETDFVARNEEFKGFVRRAAELALEAGGDAEKLLAAPVEAGGASVSDTLTALVAKIGENMSVRRAAALAVEPGVVVSYVHNAASPELGKIGVLVALKSSADAEKLTALGKQIAMHIAATAPIALSPEHVPADVAARERAIYSEQARESGKPENIIEKMVEGRMRKFYEESVLLQQVFVIDGETPVGKVVEKAAKDLGAPVEIVGFLRFAVGEGIEKADADFADEVKAMAGR